MLKKLILFLIIFSMILCLPACNISKPKKGENDESGSSQIEPEHTHVFAEATCISPQKCSCGVTEGEALGHDYVDGECSRCGKIDLDSLPVGLEKVVVVDSSNYSFNEGSFTDAYGYAYSNYHDFKAPAYAFFYLDNQYSTFNAEVVCPDTKEPVTLNIYVDDKLIHSVPNITKFTKATKISVNVSGVSLMKIETVFDRAYQWRQCNLVNAQLTKQK